MSSPRSFRRSLIGAAALLALAPQAWSANYTWNIGNLSASGVPASLGAIDTLSIGYGNYKYVDTGLSNAGAVSWVDTLYFNNGNTISNSGSWVAAANGAFADGGNSGSFLNTGSFDAAGNTVTVQGNVSFVNSGIVNADAGGVVNLSGNTTLNAGSQFTGAGVVSINNGAAFNGAFSSQNLQLAAGSYTGTGAQLNGTVNWLTGTLRGDWQVQAGATLNLQPGNYHYLSASLANLGTMNAQDTLYLQNGSTLTNQGLYALLNDSGFADGGNSGSFVNNAVLRKSGGSGNSVVNGVAFVNGTGATIDVQTGSLSFASGNNTFNAGTAFTGAGQVLVTSNASFNGAFTSQNLQLLAGIYTGTGAQLGGTVNWVTGTLRGDWQVQAGATLNLQPGNYHYVSGSVDNLGTMNVRDTLLLANGNTLTNHGLYDIQVDSGFADGGNSGSFVNDGVLRKSGGSGSSIVSGIGFTNNGQIDVQTGTLNFQGGSFTFNDGTQFTGAGQVAVTTNASFVGGFTTAGNLTLANGIFTGGDGTAGSMAVMNGDTTWSTGRLAGTWQLPVGHTLTMTPGNYHYINGSVTNLGTVVAQDTLYLTNGNTFSNQALYDIQVDSGFADGGNSGVFVNNGVLRKSGGSGSSNVNGIAFTNNGQIDVQTGTFNFQGGSLRFNDGTAFTGAGQALVSANATFVGNISTASNLVLVNGGFTGGDGTAGSKAVLNGNTTWSTGTLAGTWNLSAGHTLTMTPGNYHYINGSVTNLGTVAAQDTLYLQNGNTLANAGRWDLQGDVGVTDGGNNGHFVNTGLLVKSSGTGVSSVASVDFVNAAAGVVDVRSGTMALPGNFTNQGTLKGSGAYAVATLHNDGHLAPGASGAAPGLLTLNGNLAQSALGSFDVGLDGASFGSLAINGAASLGGTIDAVCLGSCSYAVGTSWIVMTTTGALSGTFAGAVQTTGFASGAFAVNYLNGNEVQLTVTEATVAAVPEPKSLAMLLAGLAAVGWVVRRRSA